jgi:hypothetical protein
MPVSRNAHHFQFSLSPEFRMNSVNMFAEFVDVDAAHIDTPISHHGMERPERKKSLASFPALPEHLRAMPIRITKKTAIAAQSQQLRSIVIFMAFSLQKSTVNT